MGTVDWKGTVNPRFNTLIGGGGSGNANCPLYCTVFTMPVMHP
jgi:hypothetical protein